ncbi:hypothetical protein PGTUg99_011200 [Puccinia graminis f. sp. tritici]|uniref:Uncharacterized protein n=1 Tax=Puccinia graminis f. sp. tritici TaxID=56615 RepID=A0A5B0MYZ9_PUCGR|nr:hypothetical protein PGTUg99_011200 [Puccinia graminis f. sp. tritici]
MSMIKCRPPLGYPSDRSEERTTMSAPGPAHQEGSHSSIAASGRMFARVAGVPIVEGHFRIGELDGGRALCTAASTARKAEAHSGQQRIQPASPWASPSFMWSSLSLPA